MIVLPTVDARLATLAEAIRRRKLERAQPVDELSRSLAEYESWLSGLDGQGMVDLLEELNRPGEDGPGLGLTAGDLVRMIEGVK